MKKAVSWLLLFLLVFAAPAQATMFMRNCALEQSLYRENHLCSHDGDYGTTTQTSGDHGLYQPMLYTHCELDGETGFYHNRARHYAPKFGKFLARDPIGYAGGSNLYSYCGGNPIDRRDPSGLDAMHTGLVLAVAVAVVATGGVVAAGSIGIIAETGFTMESVGVIASTFPTEISMLAGFAAGGAMAPGGGALPPMGNFSQISSALFPEGIPGFPSQRMTFGPLTIGEIFQNPQMLRGRCPSQIGAMFEGQPGWTVGPMARGKMAGRGLVIQGVTGKGNPTDLVIEFNPGIPRHFGGASYWKVSSGPGGTVRFPQY